MDFDLTQPNNAYIFGLLQTDGHLREETRNRSQITIEISEKDSDIIYKIDKILPVKAHISSRIRTTNFSRNYKSITLRICNYEFKEKIKALGLPVGKKSAIIAPPKGHFSKVGYYRGIIDGDGSLGITATKIPFISLVTDSDDLKDAYCELIFGVCGVNKSCKRNKRDNIYNICLYKEGAQALIKYLYPDDCLALQRKIDKAKEALAWVRPKDMRRRITEIKRWTSEQEEFILTHSVEESMNVL